MALQCLHNNFNLLQINRALQEEYPQMRGLRGGCHLKKAAGEMIISLCNNLLLFSYTGSSNTNAPLMSGHPALNLGYKCTKHETWFLHSNVVLSLAKGSDLQCFWFTSFISLDKKSFGFHRGTLFKVKTHGMTLSWTSNTLYLLLWLLSLSVICFLLSISHKYE